MTAPNNPASGVVSGPIILKFDDLDALAHALRGRESWGLVPWDRFCSEWPSDFADDFRLHARELIAKHGVSKPASDAGAVERDVALIEGLMARLKRTALNETDAQAHLQYQEAEALRTLLATAAADKAEVGRLTKLVENTRRAQRDVLRAEIELETADQIATLQARIAELEGGAAPTKEQVIKAVDDAMRLSGIDTCGQPGNDAFCATVDAVVALYAHPPAAPEVALDRETLHDLILTRLYGPCDTITDEQDAAIFDAADAILALRSTDQEEAGK